MNKEHLECHYMGRLVFKSSSCTYFG